MQFAMDQVIKGATAVVRRRIVVEGDRCLYEHEEPFHFSTDLLQVMAWSDAYPPGRCLTWGLLDQAIDGLRQCGYQQGKYNVMSCAIAYGPRDEVGFVLLKKLQ